MVLEARHRGRDAVSEVGLEQHIPDQPSLTRDGLERKELRARHPRSVSAPITASEKLVAAADGEERRACLDGSTEIGAARCQVGRDQRLLAVLAAADVDEVEGPRLERISGLDRGHLERVPAQRRPTREDGDVAAVGVDVEVVRVEMGDADLHAVSSQNGRASPRATATERSSSIAV